MGLSDQDETYEQLGAEETNTTSPVKQWIDAFNTHDVTRIASLYTEDAELCDTGMKRPRRGLVEIRHWFAERFQKMPDLRYTPTRFFAHKGEVVVCWIAQGQTPPLLHQRWLIQPFKVDGTSVFLLRAGLVCWQHGYYDHLQIAEAVLPPLRWLPLRL